jgi:hypothetical protein
MEWLRLVKQYDRNPFTTRSYFFGEAHEWWMSIDFDIRWKITWDKFEELFSDKWIRDTKIEAMYKIQEELKESKEEIKKKGDELSKIRNLNEALLKKIQKLK